jgi:hypothetical protein
MVTIIDRFHSHHTVCGLIISNIQNFEPTDGNGKTSFQLTKEQGHEEITYLIKSVKKEAKRKITKKRRLD